MAKKVHGNTGRMATEEARQAMREGWEAWREDGKKKQAFTRTHRRHLSEAKQGENNNRYGTQHSDDSKELQRVKATGRKQTAATVAKKAEANRGKVREKKHCEWCDQDVAVNGYARFHGDNCKLNPASPRFKPTT